MVLADSGGQRGKYIPKFHFIHLEDGKIQLCHKGLISLCPPAALNPMDPHQALPVSPHSGRFESNWVSKVQLSAKRQEQSLPACFQPTLLRKQIRLIHHQTTAFVLIRLCLMGGCWQSNAVAVRDDGILNPTFGGLKHPNNSLFRIAQADVHQIPGLSALPNATKAAVLLL